MIKDSNNNYTYKRNIVSIHSRKALVSTQRLKYKAVASLSEMDGFLTVERRGSHENSRKNLLNTYTGVATASSMRNLQKCTDVFFMRAKPSHGLNPITKKMGFFAAAFITLTIPDISEQIDSAKGYKRLLKKFIQRLQYNFGVEAYIWRFEWQKRMQGHWHLFVDRFCPIDDVKRFWLKYLDEEGLMKDFMAKYDYEPGSACKILGMRDEGMLRWYLNKYIVKKSQSETPTDGHLWGAATFLKQMPLPKLPVTLRFLDNVEAAEKRREVSVKDIEIDALDEHKLVKRTPDGEAMTYWVCTIIRGIKKPITEYLCQEQRKIYDEFIKAYRVGDVIAAKALCYCDDDIKAHYERWKAERYGGYQWKKVAENRLKIKKSGIPPPA